MKITTTIDGRIDAAHVGPFADQVHGHTYEVRVWIESRRNSPVDAGDLQRMLDIAISRLDHGTVDDVLGKAYATCEGIAHYLFTAFAGAGVPVERVRVGAAGGGRGAEVER